MYLTSMFYMVLYSTCSVSFQNYPHVLPDWHQKVSVSFVRLLFVDAVTTLPFQPLSLLEAWFAVLRSAWAPVNSKQLFITNLATFVNLKLSTDINVKLSLRATYTYKKIINHS